MHSSSLPALRKNWAVLYYGGGTNDLQSSIRHAWQQMQGEALPQNVDLFVQHFDSEGHRQEAHFEGGGEQVLLPRSEHPVNSGAGETYRDFLLAGMKRFPASHYLVIVGSHGAGADGVVVDEVAGDTLSLQELRAGTSSAQAANHGKPIDMVLFDACQMGAAETAISLEGTTETMVASLDNVGNSGFHLPTILREASKADDSRSLARSLVGNREDQQMRSFRTLAAVDLRDLKPFRSALKDWSEKVSRLDPEGIEVVRGLVEDARRNSNAPETQAAFDSIAEDLLAQYPVDLGLLDTWLDGTRPGQGLALSPFLKGVLESPDLCRDQPQLVESAKALLEAHDQILVAQRTDSEEVGGLTLHVPLRNELGPLYAQDDGPMPEIAEAGWESAYDAIVPEGECIPRKMTWLENELGPMIPKRPVREIVT